MPVLQAAIDARGATAGAKTFSAATQRIRAESGRTAKSVGALSGSMASVGRAAGTMRRMIGGLFVGIGATMAVRSAIKVNKEYEFSMAKLRAVAGATDEEFARMAKTTRQLGATTRYSASEAAEGMLELTKMGFSVEESIAAAGATLNFATAGFIGLAEASGIVAASLKQFQLGAKETNRVGNVFINTANNSGAAVTDMAEAMKMAGGVMASTGNSIEITAAAVGVLGDRAIKGSMAGTNLRGIMAALMDPTTKLTKALGKLGISYDEVNPEKKNLIEIFERFHKAQMSASDATVIFGRRNFNAALALASSIPKWKELLSIYEDTGSAMESNAAIMRETLTGALAQMRSAWEELMLKMGEAGFLPGIRRAVDTVTELIRIIGATPAEIEKASVAARTFHTILEDTKWVVEGIVNGFKALTLLRETAAGPKTIGTEDFKRATELRKLIQDTKELIVSQEKLLARPFVLFRSRQENWLVELRGDLKTYEQELSGLMDKMLKDLVQAPREAAEQLNEIAKLNAEAAAIISKEIAEMRRAEAAIFAVPLTGIPLANIRDQFAEIEEAALKMALTIQKPFEMMGAEPAAKGWQDYWVMLDNLRFESTLIGKTNEERRKAIELHRMEAVLRAGGITNQQMINQALLQYGTILDSIAEKESTWQKQQAEIYKLRHLADDMGDAFGVAFERMIMGSQSAGEALRYLYMELTQLVLHEFFTVPLASMISSGIRSLMVSALGAPAGVAAATPMASGGIIERPTLFPMANGFGLAGERGPEAIMPLKRTSSGKLGVQAEGRSNINITMNITTPDADSFRRSRGQIMRDLSRIGRLQ